MAIKITATAATKRMWTISQLLDPCFHKIWSPNIKNMVDNRMFHILTILSPCSLKLERRKFYPRNWFRIFHPLSGLAVTWTFIHPIPNTALLYYFGRIQPFCPHHLTSHFILTGFDTIRTNNAFLRLQAASLLILLPFGISRILTASRQPSPNFS